MEASGELVAIAILLAVVTFVIMRLPKVDEVTHSEAFKRRRVMNWLPLGLTYAFLYMGRYNLKISKFAFEEMKGVDGGALMGNDDFGNIFTVGVLVYGSSFVLNGPLTDRFGEGGSPGALGEFCENPERAGTSDEERSIEIKHADRELARRACGLDSSKNLVEDVGHARLIPRWDSTGKRPV